MSGYRYSREDPHWVEAESVQYASKDGHFVHVTYNGKEFRNCRVQWSNPFFDMTKSDVLVADAEGNWLKIWFYDADVLPYEESSSS